MLLHFWLITLHLTTQIPSKPQNLPQETSLTIPAYSLAIPSYPTPNLYPMAPLTLTLNPTTVHQSHTLPFKPSPLPKYTLTQHPNPSPAYSTPLPPLTLQVPANNPHHTTRPSSSHPIPPNSTLTLTHIPHPPTYPQPPNFSNHLNPPSIYCHSMFYIQLHYLSQPHLTNLHSVVLSPPDPDHICSPHHPYYHSTTHNQLHSTLSTPNSPFPSLSHTPVFFPLPLPLMLCTPPPNQHPTQPIL